MVGDNKRSKLADGGRVVSFVNLVVEAEEMKRWLAIVGVFWLGMVASWSVVEEKKEVVFCNVGQGDGMVAIDGSNQLVVDVGPDNGRMVECLASEMGWRDRDIEAVVITHADSDHMGGLIRLLEAYRVKKVLIGGRDKEVFEQLNYPVEEVGEGDKIHLGQMEYEIVSDSSGDGTKAGGDNETGLVGVLRYGTIEAWLMADADTEVERKLVWRGLLGLDPGKLRILKIGHHGSGTSTSQEILEAIRPEEAVVSVGKNNFGHPAAEVIERLGKMGIKIRRTDKEGAIRYRL